MSGRRSSIVNELIDKGLFDVFSEKDRQKYRELAALNDAVTEILILAEEAEGRRSREDLEAIYRSVVSDQINDSRTALIDLPSPDCLNRRLVESLQEKVLRIFSKWTLLFMASHEESVIKVQPKSFTVGTKERADWTDLENAVAAEMQRRKEKNEAARLQKEYLESVIRREISSLKSEMAIAVGFFDFGCHQDANDYSVWLLSERTKVGFPWTVEVPANSACVNPLGVRNDGTICELEIPLDRNPYVIQQWFIKKKRFDGRLVLEDDIARRRWELRLDVSKAISIDDLRRKV